MPAVVFLRCGDQGVRPYTWGCFAIEYVTRSKFRPPYCRLANLRKKVPAHIELLAQRVARGRYHLRTLPPGNAQLFVVGDELTRKHSRWDKKLCLCTAIARNDVLQLYYLVSFFILKCKRLTIVRRYSLLNSKIFLPLPFWLDYIKNYKLIVEDWYVVLDLGPHLRIFCHHQLRRRTFSDESIDRGERQLKRTIGRNLTRLDRINHTRHLILDVDINLRRSSFSNVIVLLVRALDRRLMATEFGLR